MKLSSVFRSSPLALSILTISAVSLSAPAYACAVLASAYDRSPTTAYYQFSTDAIYAWRVMLKDVTTSGPAPGGWSEIANGTSPGAPVGISGKYSPLNPLHSYRLRIDLKCAPGPGGWTIGADFSPLLTP